MKVPVLFPKIFDYPFTYKSDISQKLNPGDFVKAPFGSNEITGVVWPYEQKTEKNFKIKKISKKINVKNLKDNSKKFLEDFNILSVQRSLKIIGIFSRLFKRDKKNRYLKFIPYTWKILELRMKGNIFLELKKILDMNIPKKLRKKNINK